MYKNIATLFSISKINNEYLRIYFLKIIQMSINIFLEKEFGKYAFETGENPLDAIAIENKLCQEIVDIALALRENFMRAKIDLDFRNEFYEIIATLPETVSPQLFWPVNYLCKCAKMMIQEAINTEQFINQAA